MRRLIPLLAVLAGLIVTQPLSAQRVSGVVADSATGAPVGTGFIVLLDEEGNEVARGLSSQAGRFTLEAPRAGRYRLRSERIGYTPTFSPFFTLGRQETVERTLSVTALAVRLETIEVAAEQQCRTRPQEGISTAAVWEEARKALAAASWTAAQQTYRYTSHSYERDLDEGRRDVLNEQSQTVTGYATAPFRSRDPELLFDEGYIVRSGDGTLYYAPDANVMLHDSFLDTHCFVVERATGSRPGMIGLAFEPARGRHVPDIQGVLWIEETSSELQSLEFTYTNQPYDLRDNRIGGTVEFMQVPSGAWIVHRWQIRMPTVNVIPATRDAFGARYRQFRMQGFRDSGSEIMQITTVNGATVYAAELATLAGVVIDSTLVVPRPLANALVRVAGTEYASNTDGSGRFQLAAPLSGQYTVTFSHLRMDSLGLIAPERRVTLAPGRRETVMLVAPPVADILAARCPDTPVASNRRVLLGVVQDAETRAPVSGAQVFASWQRIAESAGVVTGAVEFETNAVANSAGIYTLCGLPVNWVVNVHAEYQNMTSGRAKLIFEGNNVAIGWDDGSLARDYYAPFWVWKLDLLVRKEK